MTLTARSRTCCTLLLSCALSAVSAAQQTQTRITLEQAIALALANNPSIKAIRTQIEQSRDQEVTAALRPNPLLSWDAQFLPVFHPGQWTSNSFDNVMQFDAGVGYLFERSGKRDRRIEAARGQTIVAQASISDAERALTFAVSQQFVGALLARSNLRFAEDALGNYQQTVRLNEERQRAGDISESDLLKIKIQLLQFQIDVSAARLANAQALASLRQLLGYDSAPRDVDVVGDLEFRKREDRLEDLEAVALRERPDLRAARSAVSEARSQVTLAEANGKQDVNATLSYSHAAGNSSLSTFFNIPLPIFNRNQGEIARTRAALTQADLTAETVEETVRTDVRNAFEAVTTAADIVTLYESGHSKRAQESREMTEFAYQHGAASLLDYLDAERSYRSIQLAYRQALANHMLAVAQLRQAVGTR
jgi:outer membrane protein, heavy metal efflux system